MICVFLMMFNSLFINIESTPKRGVIGLWSSLNHPQHDAEEFVDNANCYEKNPLFLNN